MLFILVGEDDFSIRQSLEEIKRSLGDQALLSANTATLVGQQLSVDELQTVCETVPFLAERRLVIVSGLLERFESKSKSGRPRKTASGQPDEYLPFAACIHQIPDSTALVLIDSGISRGNPLLKEMSAKAVVRSFPLLREAKLRRWIQGRVSDEGGSISPQAVDLLVALVGGNLWIMANEINKLVLFTLGHRIEEEDVKIMVSHGQEANVFAMVDAILESRATVAERLLQQLMQKGASPAYLMVMLARQIRLVVRAKELRNQGKSEIEVQNKLGLAEFALRKTLEQAARYHLERLKEVYRKLLETDLAIKTGKCNGDLALTMLVAELCCR